MNKKWRCLIAILCVAVLLVNQSGIDVFATEDETKNEDSSESETETTEESGTETETETTEESGTQTETETNNESETETTVDKVEDEPTQTITIANVENGESGYVVNLGWSKDTPGMAVFETTYEGAATIQTVLYKISDDGSESRVTSSTFHEKGAIDAYQHLQVDIDSDGIYYYKVTLIPDDENVARETYTVGIAYEYIRPEESVESPTDVSMDSNGVATWSAVDNANYYIVGLYQNGYDENGKLKLKKICDSGTADTTYDFSSLIDDEHDYYLKVTSCSSNIEEYGNSINPNIIYINMKVSPMAIDDDGEDDEDEDDSSDDSSDNDERKTTGTLNSWKSLVTELEKATSTMSESDDEEEKTSIIVTVNLNGTSKVPASAIEAIAEKDVTMRLIVDSNTIVTINGQALEPSDAKDVRIYTRESENDGETLLSVRASNVNLEKNITVYSNQGSDRIGKMVALLFENADKSYLEFRVSPVYDNGYAAFITPFVNANYKIKVKD